MSHFKALFELRTVVFFSAGLFFRHAILYSVLSLLHKSIWR